jgi:hypothetical protein
MDAPKGNQFAVSVALPRPCSSDSALVQAKTGMKPGGARPFFPPGLPQPAANPQGFLHRKGASLRLMLKRSEASYFLSTG